MTHDATPLIDGDGNAAIDVVVPVYNAASDLVRCVDSVLLHTTLPYRLVLIDDASPDQAIAAYFAELAQRGLRHVALLRNASNLGFIGTANRGMQLSRADVVLLNSDTVVTAGWLDALSRCARSDPTIGTITPFSNNAEICSFPQFCRDNPWPHGADPEPVRAALSRAAVPTYPELPTGVGFCLYVRRHLLDAIGAFDAIFGRGYGEENDFCLRAVRAGYRNVLCDDAFVLHLGGRSFAGQKAELGTRNLALLLERHPHYATMVRDYIAADPLRPLREVALTQWRVSAGPSGAVLHVIHGHGGGTEHHVRALIDASRREFRHYLAIAVGDAWQLEEHLDDCTVRAFNVTRLADEPWSAFVGGLCTAFGITFIHLHNISGCRTGLTEALAASHVRYGYTVHDLNFACPTITFLGHDGKYCGAQTDPAICAACLQAQPAFADVDIVAWRDQHRKLLANAAFLIAPSRWAAATLDRYFPGLRVEVIAHGAPGVWAAQLRAESKAANGGSSSARLAVMLPDDDVPSVAVLGAIGPDKGARRLERLVALARERNAAIRFVLIGYLDREHGPWQSDDARFTIHGRYDPRDLPDLLRHYRVRLVIYPSAGPETFSFTLSEAWAAGRPAIVPPIGALAERMRETGAGWIWREEEWASEERMLDTIESRLAPPQELLSAAAARARAAPQSTLRTMSERTLRLYAACAAPRAESAAHAAPSLDPARLRDALGYRPWHAPKPEPATLADEVAAVSVSTSPPAPAVPPSAAPPWPGRVARWALRIRPTLAGRLLFHITPRPIVDALKSRLHEL